MTYGPSPRPTSSALPCTKGILDFARAWSSYHAEIAFCPNTTAFAGHNVTSATASKLPLEPTTTSMITGGTTVVESGLTYCVLVSDSGAVVAANGSLQIIMSPSSDNVTSSFFLPTVFATPTYTAVTGQPQVVTLGSYVCQYANPTSSNEASTTSTEGIGSAIMSGLQDPPSASQTGNISVSATPAAFTGGVVSKAVDCRGGLQALIMLWLGFLVA